MKHRFGPLLRKLREEAGKSMGDVARHLEVSVVFVSDVEKGRRSPLAFERIMAFAEFLECDAQPLLVAAATEKGAFQLDAEKASPKKMAVGAALMRGWADLQDPDLDAINKIIEGKKRKE